LLMAQFDSTNDGRPIKIISIIDEHTRERLDGLFHYGQLQPWNRWFYKRG
jgi:hypothetical protein